MTPDDAPPPPAEEETDSSVTEDWNTPEMKRLIRTGGMRPSRSAEAAFERELAEIEAMTVEQRMLLALRLGLRDQRLAEGRAGKRGR